MDITAEAQGLKEIIGTLKNEEIVIFLPETATRDTMAAALSLYLSFTSDPLHKLVKVAYPKPPTVAWSHLVGINKVIPAVGNKNFIISLDYIEGSIERVSYNIEGNKFNLVIEPKPGTEMFSEKNVHYNYSGLNAGLLIIIGAQSLEQLGKTYTDNKKIFDSKPIVVLDHNIQNKQYGKVNLVRPASCTSEIVAHVLSNGAFPVSSDIATNLYDGLVTGSRNFSSPQVTASTFEAAALLMKNGARRQTPGFMRVSEELPRGEFATSREEEKQLPPDWLKPKIFKGSSLL